MVTLWAVVKRSRPRRGIASEKLRGRRQNYEVTLAKMVGAVGTDALRSLQHLFTTDRTPSMR